MSGSGRAEEEAIERAEEEEEGSEYELASMYTRVLIGGAAATVLGTTSDPAVLVAYDDRALSTRT